MTSTKFNIAMHIRSVRRRPTSARGSATHLLLLTGLAGILAASGWGIANGHATLLFVGVALAGLGALAFAQRGACIAILLLAAMDGLPFVDSARIVTAKLTVGDFATVALILVAALWIVLDDGTYRPSRVGQVITRVGALLLLLWLCTVARSASVPVLRAAAYGRDFLYLALLLIVLPRVRLASRDVHALLGVLVAGVCLFAAGQIMVATGFGRPGGLIHYQETAQELGLTRIYTPMTDLINAALAASVAASLLARQRIVRMIAIPVALLLTISVVVQLTRARWIGFIVGIVFVILWLITKGEAHLASVLRRRLALVVGILGFVAAVALLATPGIVSGGAIGNRVLSIFTNLQSGSGTVGYRQAVTRTLTGYLGGQWPFGLGLLPPKSHYFVGLPGGSIRNPDVGVLNAVTTIGVVGALLIYFPLILTLAYCLRRSSTEPAGGYAWLRYGGAVWIVATLVSSVTLVTLFSASGLALTAVFLTILLHPSVSEASLRVTATHPEATATPAVTLAGTGIWSTQKRFP